VVVIPKSTHKNRMEENLDVFDFELTAEEMGKIAALDTGESAFFSHYDPQTVEFITNLGKQKES
jgi:diketogulonate reductase-like aldo/keto reductase